MIDNGKPVIEPASLLSNPAVSFAVPSIDANSKRILVEASGLALTQPQAPETLMIEASIKPFVSVVWIGSYLVAAGFFVSIYRRWKERQSAKTA